MPMELSSGFSSQKQKPTAAAGSFRGLPIFGACEIPLIGMHSAFWPNRRSCDNDPQIVASQAFYMVQCWPNYVTPFECGRWTGGAEQNGKIGPRSKVILFIWPREFVDRNSKQTCDEPSPARE